MKVALCVDGFTVAVPKTVVPFLKDTVPAGLPPNFPVTIAVNVTVWRKAAGFGEEINAVLVAALSTVCVKTGEVLAEKLASPE